MFGGLLRLELRRTTARGYPGLHQLAARWLAERGQAADAIGHLQAAGDWDEAARMLTDHALSLTLDGQAGTVAALLRSFPAWTGEDSPDLTLVRAIADQYQLRLDQTDAHLREVRAYAATTPPPAGIGWRWPSPPWTCCQRGCAGTSTASSSRQGHFCARATARRAPTSRSAAT